MIVFPKQKIVSYTAGLHPDNIFPLAFYHSKDNKDLCFLAADHVLDIQSETHRLVDRIISVWKPEAVIVEGLGTLTEPSWSAEREQHYYKLAHDDMDRAAPIPESLYALYLAKLNSLAVFSGEPSDEAQMMHLLQNGYTQQDFIFFSFLLTIDYWTLRNIPDEKLTNIWQGCLTTYAPLTFSAKNYVFSDFETWFEQKALATFSLDKMNGHFIAPKAQATFGTLGHIASILSRFRDECLLNAMEKTFVSFNKVLVVYGGSHYFTLKPALDAVMQNLTVI